jgi:hypothetical protein
MWLPAKMHNNGNKTVLTLDQAAAEVGTDGQMDAAPHLPLGQVPRYLRADLSL